MSSFPWLRLYTETLTDRKFKLVSSVTGQPRPLVLGVWCSLLMLAGESPERGKLLFSRGKPISFSFICDEIGVDEETGRAILEEFIALDMIFIDDGGVYTITKWDERQFKSDDTYARVKKFRDKNKDKKAPKNVQETPNDNASRNVSETFLETPQSQIQSQSQNQIPNGGDKSPEVEKPKKQLMSAFLDETGLKMPHRKSDISFWWSSIQEISELVNHQVGPGSNLIRRCVRKMRTDGLTISNPNSIINICRAIQAEGSVKNGTSPPIDKARFEQLQAESAKELYDPLKGA